MPLTLKNFNKTTLPPIADDWNWVSSYDFPTQGISFNTSEYECRGTTIKIINEDSFGIMLPRVEGASIQSIPSLYNCMQSSLPEGFGFSLDDGNIVSCSYLTELNSTDIYSGDEIPIMFYIDGIDNYDFDGYGLAFKIRSTTAYSGTACVFFFIIEAFNQYNGYPMSVIAGGVEVGEADVNADGSITVYVSEEMMESLYGSGAKLLVLPIAF